ncbi:MAG: hypothetical protein U9Q20_06865 [Campylobacterota bacterium]|nr:hypothetical protein [Campylobacterota bacterium]
MITDIIEDRNYKAIVENQIYDTIDFLLDKDQEFSLTANIEAVSFNPPIPDTIAGSFSKFTLFTLANYTYESIQLTQDDISFEAGFGSENFGSVVTIPLAGIFQIVIDESILYLNPTATVQKHFIKNVLDEDENQESRSKNAFKLNTKNKKLFD